ncbi:MAG TPA: VWA domain-containing protein [Bacteroidia bacterium]|nr:VWA domain-containing protein [Bacteroidia bacterium]
MSFLAPAFLWTLLALLPLAAAYFLKVRPRRRPATAFFLWERVFEQKRATSLLQRLRDAISLLLMLLAFAAVAFALARPELVDDERKDLLILIDQSASMSAKDGGRSRLDEAKRVAREIVAAMDGNQRAAVAAAGRELRFLTHLGGGPRELAEAIDRVEATVFPFDPASLRGLDAEAQGSDRHRVLLLSDGCFEGSDALPGGIELVKVGAPLPNLGIVAADLRRLPGGSLGFFFKLASSYPDPVEADLVLTHAASGDRIFKLIPVRVEPGENRPEQFTVEEAPADGAWIAELRIDDALAEDNRAFLSVPGANPVRVKVGAQDRFFFEVSVCAFEDSGGTLKLAEEDAEVRIARGSADGEDGAFLLFAPEGASPWWEQVGEEVEVVAPRVLLPGHPAIRHLDLANLSFAGARSLKAPPGALVLAESEHGVPLVYRMVSGGATALVVNLDPLASEFVLSPWFPVLVHGAATHLAGREEEVMPLYRPGDRLAVPGRREGEMTRVLTPGAESAIDWPDAQYGPLERLGFYEFENASGRWTVGSTLATRAESLLDNAAVAGSVRSLARGYAPATWLLAAAIVLLVGESMLYHRRKAG